MTSTLTVDVTSQPPSKLKQRCYACARVSDVEHMDTRDRVYIPHCRISS